MTDLRKAAEMALRDLTLLCHAQAYDTVEALRQALAQPEQEQPKHWSDCSVYNEPAYPNGECDCGGFDLNNKWHGLTEEEAEKLAFDVIVGGVSKALAQPVQESAKLDCSAPFVMTPHRVFAKPPKREWVGLTHEERDEIDQSCRSQMEALFAIEAKLKEKNK
jgi:hypothetical protein